MAKLSTSNKLFAITFFLGALAVILGAFGAHLLAEKLAAKQLGSFKTGVLYHFIHVLAALLVLIIASTEKSKVLIWSAILFLIGILLFSGSLYLLSTRELIGLSNYKWLGPITPIGGLFFIAGWFTSAIFFLRK